MIPRLAAMRDAGVEQLLRGRGRGQGDAERAGAVERQVEILLMQLDPEAWFEITLYHAFTMYFEDPGGREAAHQSLTHQCRIGAGFGGEQQSFADGFDGQRDDDLFGDLGGLAVTVFTDAGDI